jgi:hypothetical protein
VDGDARLHVQVPDLLTHGGEDLGGDVRPGDHLDAVRALLVQLVHGLPALVFGRDLAGRSHDDDAGCDHLVGLAQPPVLDELLVRAESAGPDRGDAVGEE